MNFVNIGYGNVVAAERVVALVSPDSAPIKRMVQDAKESGRAIDASAGKRTRAVIITDSEHVILSALTVEMVTKRLNARSDTGDTDFESDDDSVEQEL